MNLPGFRFLEGSEVAFLVFRDSDLSICHANQCARLWYGDLQVSTFGNLFSRVNVERMRRRLRTGKRFKTAVETDGEGEAPAVAHLEVVRVIHEEGVYFGALIVDVAAVGERAAIYRSFAALAEAEGKSQRRKLASFPRENPNPVLATDPFGAVVYMNPSVNRLIEELKLSGPLDLLPSAHRDLVKAEGGGIDAESNVGDRCFIWSYHALRDPREVRVYGREITAIRAAQRETSLAEAKLERSKRDQAIGQLAGGFAHDFNNLLGVIVGYTDLAAEISGESEMISAHLKQVKVAAERGRSIVAQILAFTRGENIEFGIVEVNDMLAETLALSRGSVSSQVVLSVDAPGDEGGPIHIHGDRGKLQQVLMNLVNNAEDAMGVEGGEIRLSARHDHGDVVIQVIDNGSGMPQEVQERIFEPYFTTKEMSGGTGLGLAMVHGIVSEHQGTIEVSSTLGNGTSFIIRIPESDSQPPSQVAKQPTRRIAETTGTPSTHSSERSVMVIDDEPALARLAVRVLEKAGLTARAFTVPAEALAALEQAPEEYWAVVTDQAMPDCTGLEILETVVSKFPALPVVICSGYGPDLNEKQVLALGGHALFHKPLDWPVLTNLLSDLHAQGFD